MKNKFQDVDFKNVEEFLDYLPDAELKIVLTLRKMIFDCIPNCQEKLSYNVPFYHRKKNICFIWPSSIAWGKMKQRGVRLGFTSGYLMRDEINYLDKGDRKQMFFKDFYAINDIESDMLKTYLFEAGLIEEAMHTSPVKKSLKKKLPKK